MTFEYDLLLHLCTMTTVNFQDSLGLVRVAFYEISGSRAQRWHELQGSCSGVLLNPREPIHSRGKGASSQRFCVDLLHQEAIRLTTTGFVDFPTSGSLVALGLLGTTLLVATGDS